MNYMSIITGLCADAADPSKNPQPEDGTMPEAIKDLLSALIEGVAVLTVPTVTDEAQAELVQAICGDIQERALVLRAKFIDFAAREGQNASSMEIQ